MESGQNAESTGQQVLSGGGSQPSGGGISVGGGEIGGIITGLHQIIDNGYGEREAARQANKFTQDQMILSNQLQTDLQNKAARHQLDYFNATAKYNSPEEQVKRLKQAGLNPALAYGGATGSGGTGQTGSVSGGSIGVPGGVKANAAGAKSASTEAGIALANIMAEIKLKESQTKKNLADAEFTEGAKTDETNARTSLIGVEADMAGVKTDGARIQNRIARIEERIAETTEASRVGMIEGEFERLKVQVQILDEDLARAVRENRIGEAQAEALMRTADAELKRIIVDTAYKATQAYAAKEGVQISKDQVKERIFENNLMSDKFDWERGNYGRELKGGVISQAWQIGGHLADTATGESDVRSGRTGASRRPYGMGDR